MNILARIRTKLRISIARRRAPNHGPCAHCGKPVRHYYPWWTSNPERGGRPLHDDCFRAQIAEEDGDA